MPSANTSIAATHCVNAGEDGAPHHSHVNEKKYYTIESPDIDDRFGRKHSLGLES